MTKADTLIPIPHADLSPALKARDSKGPSSDGDGDGAILVPMIAHFLRAEGFDASEDGTGRGTPLVPCVAPTLRAGGNRTGGDRPPGADVDTCESLVPVAVQASQSGIRLNDTVGTLDANYGSRRHNGVLAPVAFAQNQRDEVRAMDVAGALSAEPGAKQQTYIAFSSKDHGADAGDIAPTLRSMGHDGSHANGGGQVEVAFHNRQDPDVSGSITHPIGAQDSGMGIQCGMQVRRLTPRECERLQGFPDDYTLITMRGKHAADGPRYKALGNSMAVPVMRWIGERVQMVEDLVL